MAASSVAPSTSAPAASVTATPTGSQSAGVPRHPVSTGLSLGGRSALVEGPTAEPANHAPRVIAHGLAVEESPVASLPRRKLHVVWPGNVRETAIVGRYSMLLPADGGRSEWLSMLLVEPLGDPPPSTFFGVEGASRVSWKAPIADPARELVSCVRFDGLTAVVEVHGDKEARIVIGDRYRGRSALTEVLGAVVVDETAYAWLEKEDRAELVSLAETPTSPDPPSGKPRCAPR